MIDNKMIENVLQAKFHPFNHSQTPSSPTDLYVTLYKSVGGFVIIDKNLIKH